MLTLSSNEIRDYLDSTFDIAFTIVEHNCASGSLKCRIFPTGYRLESFVLEVVIHSEFSLRCAIKPGRYGAPFVSGLGGVAHEKKAAYCVLASKLRGMGAKLSERVNDRDIALSLEDWPSEWNDFAIRANVISLFQASDGDSEKRMVVLDWLAKLMSLILVLCDIEPTYLESTEFQEEGRSFSAISKRYERSRVNREICIAAKGTACSICGFDFGKAYGRMGEGFIHVHHVVPVATMEGPRILNPLEDLIPICPNCHAMIHINDPALAPEELCEILAAANNRSSSVR